MLATKPNPWGIQDITDNGELKWMPLEFVKNVDGLYVAGIKKPKDYVDGYCQINYTTVKSSMNIVAIQDKRTRAFLFATEAQDAGCNVEEFDDGFLVYFKDKPRNDLQFWYRYDTEYELYAEEDDVGY